MRLAEFQSGHELPSFGIDVRSYKHILCLAQAYSQRRDRHRREQGKAEAGILQFQYKRSLKQYSYL